MSEKLKVNQQTKNAFLLPITYEMVACFAEQVFQWNLKPEHIDNLEREDLTVDAFSAKERKDLLRKVEPNSSYLLLQTFVSISPGRKNV